MIEKIVLDKRAYEKLVMRFITQANAEAADRILVEFTGYEMRKRLEEQRSKGFSGWNTAQCENENLKNRLLQNAKNDDWIDVINLAAMLLARERMFHEVPLKRG